MKKGNIRHKGQKWVFIRMILRRFRGYRFQINSNIPRLDLVDKYRFHCVFRCFRLVKYTWVSTVCEYVAEIPSSPRVVATNTGNYSISFVPLITLLAGVIPRIINRIRQPSQQITDGRDLGMKASVYTDRPFP